MHCHCHCHMITRSRSDGSEMYTPSSFVYLQFFTLLSDHRLKSFYIILVLTIYKISGIVGRGKFPNLFFLVYLRVCGEFRPNPANFDKSTRLNQKSGQNFEYARCNPDKKNEASVRTNFRSQASFRLPLPLPGVLLQVVSTSYKEGQ